MRVTCAFVTGVIAGVLLAVGIGLAAAPPQAGEPAVLLRNGLLEGWVVTRDDEALLCVDPVVFVPARQIECP